MRTNELASILQEAVFLSRDGRSLYRVYQIPKSTGGFREICEPIPELKALQKKLIPFFKKFRISKFCAAYEPGCSTKKNALRHCKSNNILHLDIKDFFPSIGYELFRKTFCKGLDERLCDLLWRAVSYQRGLPIGAPTSPFIANRVLLRTDAKLSRLRAVYTRYADDLIFSSKKFIPEKLCQKATKILNAAGFSINLKKTFFMSSRKEVTGILVHAGKLSVGTSYKKRLKQDIYNLLTKGTGSVDALRGRLSYLAYIEPLYANRIEQKYACLDKIGFFAT